MKIAIIFIRHNGYHFFKEISSICVGIAFRSYNLLKCKITFIEIWTSKKIDGYKLHAKRKFGVDILELSLLLFAIWLREFLETFDRKCVLHRNGSVQRAVVQLVWEPDAESIVRVHNPVVCVIDVSNAEQKSKNTVHAIRLRWICDSDGDAVVCLHFFLN